ncbi:MAG: outer membrane lipoprotein carrier protein LolA [Alphaproteobacteria bacterium]|nr:outer membrane lipoprotein carrier protein LolA [Alphaproteobacteria bacterium]
MKKLFALLTALLLLSSGAARAQNAENIRKIEDYLNNIKSMEATFVQMASNGATAEGRLFIKKPNKIRMEYADPTNVLIVGDGDFIVYNDTELDQVTHINYDDIPASLILANDIKIDGQKIKISDFYQDAGSTSITLDYADKGDLGPITLVFSNSPMELKQWKIVDPQSVEVSVSLYDIKKDNDLSDKIFKFKKAKSGGSYKKKK